MKVCAIGIGLLLLAAACGKDSPQGPALLPGTRVVSALLMEGSTSIQPGSATQLRATAIYSDGIREDVTARAAWTSTDPAVIQFNSPGLALATAAGETVVQVDFQQRRASASVLVLPANTFRLVGIVSDGSFPIENARVEVASGTGAGLTATTNFLGQFKFYGVAGDLQLRATAGGHQTRTRDVAVNSNQNVGAIVLEPLTIAEVGGDWTLTIEASASCDMPDEGRRRSYKASVRRSGTALSVTLSEATFSPGANWFWGRLTADGGIDVDLSGYYVPYAISERIDSTSSYVVRGRALGRATASSMTAALTGEIGYLRTGQPTGVCTSGALTFVRR